MFKIDVLGSSYTVKVDETGCLERLNADGIHKQYENEIVVRDTSKFLCEDDSIEAKEARKKEVLRHEITHAFFSQSGLDDYCRNEQLVDWIAIQFPKMQKAFEEAGAL